MKIKDYKLFTVKPRWIFLKITTDDGYEGWGEVVSGTRTRTIVEGAKEMCDRVIGFNSDEIENIWQFLYRHFFRGGPIAMSIISGIEMALWDIKGKKLETPVYNLLGGKVRDRLKVYSWVGGDRPNEVLEQVDERYKLGFRAVKMNGTEELHYIDSFNKVNQVIERVSGIREKYGYEMDIAVDFHGRVHKPMAKVLINELAPFKLMFIEEPLLPENNDVLKHIYPLATMPIATGERLYSRWDFKSLLSDGFVDIIQPDVALAGGIFESRKIAAMAESFDIGVAPHAPYGPISLAATFQLDACTPNVFIQEQSLRIHYNEGEFDLLDFVKNKEIFDFKDGYANIPTGNGLGIELDENLIEEVSKEGLYWRNPLWKNYDGTIAEW